MSKRNKIIFAIAVAVAWIIVLSVLAIVFLPKLLNPEPEIAHTPQETLDIAMEALIGEGTTEPILLGADGTPVGVTKSTGLAELITAQVEYKILSIEVAETTAVATMEIQAPDTLAVVQQVIKAMESFDEAAFLEQMATLLQGNIQTITKTVSVNMVLVDNNWCVVTNPEFSDAITGGMISRYLELQESIMAALKKEGQE